jgi:DNA-dependent RNA polymerase auxiliary subunit epsilon
MQLWKLVLQFAKIIDEKEYNGFSREEVLKKMTITGEFESDYENRRQESNKKLYSIIEKKPEILITLSPSKLKSFLDAYPDSFYRGIIEGSEFKEIYNKIPRKNKELIINSILNGEYRSSLYTFFGYDGKFEIIGSQLIIEYLKNKNTINGFLNNIIGDIIISDVNDLNVIVNAYAKSDFKASLIKLLKQNEHMLNEKIYKILIQNYDMNTMYIFDNIPSKIQMMMVKKNPYNIQYINNPSDSVVSYIKQKYGDVYDYFILGAI